MRVSGTRYKRYECGVGGARALAVYGEYVMLFDDYEHRGIARGLELSAKGASAVIGEHEVVLPEEGSIVRAPVTGVGHALYILNGKRLSGVDAWW